MNCQDEHITQAKDAGATVPGAGVRAKAAGSATVPGAGAPALGEDAVADAIALASDAACSDTPNDFANRRRMLIGAAFVVIAAMSWGFSGTCVQYLTQEHGVDVRFINSMRMIVPALVLLPVCLARRHLRVQVGAIVRSRKHLFNLIMYAIFGAFLCQIGYLYTISYTNAGTATMMEQLGILIVVAVTCIGARRGPTAREVVALALALAGTFLICTQGNPGSLAICPEGLAWGLFSTIGMATYILLPEPLMRHFDGVVVTALAMLVGGAFCLVVFQPWTCAPTLTVPVIVGLTGTIVMGTLVAYIMFLEGVKRAGAVVSGLLDALEPAAAIGFSALWLGTLVTPFDLMGCALIIGMIVLVVLPR